MGRENENVTIAIKLDVYFYQCIYFGDRNKSVFKEGAESRHQGL